MSARSLGRLLSHNIQIEKTGLPVYCEVVRQSQVIEAPGSYFCDASEGPITLTLRLSANTFDGCKFTVKKIDTTNHKVVVDASDVGGIEGMEVIELLLRFECLDLQRHESRLFLV